ncbi:MAG: hypothetical protein CVU39_23240 [Chloroflexi bacterium HGW-Chloroflexi-10]|nr:MAG: hypothetical protein CVU39_23240 [Chloroflexi bacterium HGW-Chloroflexi-10]
MDDPIEDRVACYSGATYAERPTGFLWQGKEYQVSRVVDTWFSPLGKSFRVCTIDGPVFLLEYLYDSARWQISLH